jgi:hypothetical protein
MRKNGVVNIPDGLAMGTIVGGGMVMGGDDER